MRFSVGLWDALFGERCYVEVRGDDGQIRRVRMTKKWLEKTEREGKARPVESVEANVLGIVGYERQVWQIGVDIKPEEVEKFRDAESGQMYAMEMLKNGQPVRIIMARPAYEVARLSMERLAQGLAVNEDEIKKLARDRGLVP